MAWNGSGTYLRIHNWVADAAVPIDITASRMDAEDDSIAAGLNNCLTRDGQNSPSANLPMGNFKHTGVAASAARTDYARVAELQDNTHCWEATDGGAADAYSITPAPAITAYAAGQRFSFIPANDNTGASTLAVSGLAAKDIKTIAGVDPVASDIRSTGVCEVIYDGTNFVLLNPGSNNPESQLVEGDGTSTTLEITSGLGGLEYDIEARIASDNASGGTYEIELNGDTTASNYNMYGIGAGSNRNTNVWASANEPLTTVNDELHIKGRIWVDESDQMQYELIYYHTLLAASGLYAEHFRGLVAGSKTALTQVTFNETVTGGNFTAESYLRLVRRR